jgi:mRNA interferase HicA
MQLIRCIVDFWMTSAEFKRWLQKQGCTFEPGKGGHLIVRFGQKMAVCRCTASRKSWAPAS